MECIRNVKLFAEDMRRLPVPVQVWASIFPFPQFILGGYFAFTRGWTASPAPMFLIARAISFGIAGYVNKRNRRTKLSGPLMHSVFIPVLLLSKQWLDTSEAAEDRPLFQFVAATTAITMASCVLDGIVGVKALMGKEIGHYKDAGEPHPALRLILPLPSLLFGLYHTFSAGKFPF